MNKKNENETFILAAGKQTRYKSPESKLMAKVNDKPLFFYTLSSILKVIPEELVSVISSPLFQDFNDYLLHHFQNIKVILDVSPGQGSAQSLKKSFPWQTEHVVVTEANIYYENYLINQLLKLVKNTPQLIGALAITPKVDIATTHRKIIIDNKIDLSGNVGNKKYFSNMGVYAFHRGLQDKIYDTPDIIEVLNVLNQLGNPLASLCYYGMYLHTATIEDVKMWHLVEGTKNV